MIAAGVARLRLAAGERRTAFSVQPDVLVVGEVDQNAAWLDLLAQRGIEVRVGEGLPVEISGSLGAFSVRQIKAEQQAVSSKQQLGSSGVFQARATRNGAEWRVGAVVLTPSDPQQISVLCASFAGRDLGSPELWPETRLPGVFVLPPNADKEVTALALVARLTVLLARPHVVNEAAIPTVDITRCRACRTCETVCPFQAVKVLPAPLAPLLGEGQLAAQVNVALCRGCGVCVARCPSGALTLRYGSDAQWTAALETLFRTPVEPQRHGEHRGIDEPLRSLRAPQ